MGSFADHSRSRASSIIYRIRFLCPRHERNPSKTGKEKIRQAIFFFHHSHLEWLNFHFMALLDALLNVNSENVWGWIIYLYMMTWIIFSMLGYLYKIVPFLVWTHKYSEMVGKEKVPTLKEMMNEKLGAILYRLFTISIFGIIVSVAFSSGIALFIFLGIQALASIIFAITIIRVLLK